MLVEKKKVLEIIGESLKKIPDDDRCDECMWLYDMIYNGVEELKENETKR